jgi:CHAD domain-containing protein
MNYLRSGRRASIACLPYHIEFAIMKSMRQGPLFEADMHIAQAGRAVFASLLATVRTHRPQLLRDADETSVHETRKAIRRTFTAFKLFAPYYEPGTLKEYRQGLKRLMHRLGRCRDVTVFLKKLANYAEVHGKLPDLNEYWQGQGARLNGKLRRYAGKAETAQFLDAYEQFTETPGLGERREPDGVVPNRVNQLAPLLIYERLALVRAFEEVIEEADSKRMHQLRIQVKELRYTLHFFAPLMGAQVRPVEVALEALQDVLGDLHDASVALRMLQESPVDEEVVATYRRAQEMEIARLSAEFIPLWQDFSAPRWRRRLAEALADL